MIGLLPATWRRLLYALLAGMAIGAALVLSLRNPQTVERVVTREREVVKWRTTTQTALKYAGVPGSTVVIGSDGSITIYGPATIDLTQSSSGQGEREVVRLVDRRVEVAQPWSWLVSAGAVTRLRWPPAPAWQVMVGHHAGRLLFAELGVAIIAQGVSASGPDFGGLAVIATW